MVVSVSGRRGQGAPRPVRDVIGGRTVKPHVLVVEDDEAVRSVLEEILDGYGYETSSVATGKAALEAVEDHRPDCIVLDLITPDLDGWGFLEVYRQRLHAAEQPPVVAITATRPLPDGQRWLEDLGAPLLLKPFNLAELRGAVGRVLARAVAADGWVPGADGQPWPPAA